MEFKDEAFGFVRDLVLRLRNKSHKAMRAIRSDNGGEFTNSQFENFCRDLGDDEEGTPIFEDEEGVDNVGDAEATAPAAAPAPSATSSDDEGGLLPTASSSLPRQHAQAEASPAEDAEEVTSVIVPSRQVQWDHPPHRMIGDIHQRVTRSTVASLAFFSHSAYVATFEPWDVSHALSDPNWVNAMHEEL
ncbi:hypothetical protein U9M48_013102 [Paspalum notatum var. saurae]|uniref:Integrase catalytic domain-containing protein n=1 Tax=Paspalum notatum var. saurae TaxID=547442 RepID=A0AAQ3WJ89_PASNO